MCKYLREYFVCCENLGGRDLGREEFANLSLNLTVICKHLLENTTQHIQTPSIKRFELEC